MHWQLGGNLEPVQMICELDWRECPKAIANYVWNEIVTDVLDCLNNEGTVWRILAVVLACTILVRKVCFKAREFIETAVDKGMLDKIGYKMDDLELKVNILTYKMQYGTWPLPHQVQKSNFRKHLRNLRLTMSSPNDRNNWIKHVLLSPRYNEYASYPKYDYHSAHRLTELFDAKKKLVYPYLRQECLPIDPSSKSSKTSSDKSLKLNSIFKRKAYRKRREEKNDNTVMEYRNAISLPLFSKNKKSKCLKDKKMTGACKKFVKTMDECKRYLKELHDSNKNLGLVCSSSNISNESSIKDWSDVEQQEQGEKENEPNEIAKEIITEETTDVKEIDTRQETSEKCSELSNAVCPVLKSSDKRILSSKMNVTFCADMFPRSSTSNMLIPEPCERTKFIKTSQEALYKVKKKLESLHNVLRSYEIQTVEAKTSARLEESNNKINSICQNVNQTIVSAITEADKWSEGKKNRVNFDTDTRKMQQTVCNNYEHEDSDATINNPMKSIQSYSNVFNTCSINNLNDPRCLLSNNSQSKIYPSIIQQLDLFHNDKIIYSSGSKYEKVPERVCYTISSDSDVGKNDKVEATVIDNFESLPDIYTDKNQANPFDFSDQYPIPVETDEDLIITSPTSSHTELSKDSESEDKSTVVLLQEALQFKKALLTRVQLEKVYMDDQKDDTNSQTIIECCKYPYVNNNLPSKLLDIISEEQSVSGSTDRTSRTYMFYNEKQEKELARSLMFNADIPNIPQHEVKDSSVNKGYLSSEHTLSSPSEYFSFTNMLQDESRGNNNQLSSSKQNYLHQNASTGLISANEQINCFNNALEKSNAKLRETNYTNCLNTSNTNMNEQKTYYEFIHEKENFENQSMHLNNRNEFINQSIQSMELYSENLDEVPSNEDNQNVSVGITSNILNSDRYKNVSYNKNANNNVLNTKKNVVIDKKYIGNNGNPMQAPNLNLKRHLGTCSLIEQVLITANIKKETETNTMIENENAMYELSPTESKETSIETNLIQDSFTSSINQSNESNIPEPPSVMVLINKSSDEEKLNLNWLNVNNKYSDECVNEADIKRLSTSTITLKKHDTANTENYTKEETCNDYKVVTSDQNNQFKNEKKNSIIKDSFISLGKESLNNQTEYYKSYSTLISPHSSLYFTDEASNSTTKMSNSHSKNLENHLHRNLHLQKSNEEKPCYKGEALKETMSSENKTTNVAMTQSNERSPKQKLSSSKSNAYSNNDVSYAKNYIQNANILENEKTPSIGDSQGITDKPLISYNDSNNNNLQSSRSMNITSSRIENFPERLNLDHQHFSPCTSPREREVNKNEAMKRSNVTVQSKSNENYNPKSEKLKKSELIHDDQNRNEDNKNSMHVRAGNTTENRVKIDKKRSRSQISIRTNESPKQVALQSHESPRNINTINFTQSMENKLKLKDLKYLSPIPKTSSKSCIPILKSRLEAARRSENETRPKSPMRGPLTMTMFWKDNLCSKNDSVMEEIQVEGKSGNYNQYIEVNSYGEKSGGNNNHVDTMKSSNILQNTIENIGNNITQPEQMVIYVNIFTKHDHNTTKIVDPNKFLKYIKNRELKMQNTEKSQWENVKNEVCEPTAENENSTMHKIVTIVSSVINGNELENMSTNTSTTNTQSESISNVITSNELRNLCFLSVEQREIDVTAKPSVIDTSTSISDLKNISDTESALSKFQICGIPRELNNDEYVTLLEILHQEPNCVHLQELQNVCKKLVSEELKSK
ncbi:uncharacterized protein LOC143266668 isoform X2 [Megachile rotundata]|uniref:uncharacterized protein LOC143266668 isoform X2 n=1 Tax=Megachile rotundata TaxID=143995 RepID=UPI003FD33C9C